GDRQTNSGREVFDRAVVDHDVGEVVADDSVSGSVTAYGVTVQIDIDVTGSKREAVATGCQVLDQDEISGRADGPACVNRHGAAERRIRVEFGGVGARAAWGRWGWSVGMGWSVSRECTK